MKRIFLLLLLTFIVLSCSHKKEQAKANETTSMDNEGAEMVSPEMVEPIFPDDTEERRTDWQNPETVLLAFDDLSSKTVADIGAGAGYFSFKLARMAKKVIALDIDPNSLEYINEQKQIVGNWSDNIEPRLTPPDVPNLLPNEVDAVLVVNTFCFIPTQEVYFERLRGGMTEDAQLVIVDFKKGEIPVGPSDDRKMDASDVRTILRRAGYKKIKVDDKSLEYQYIIKATK